MQRVAVLSIVALACVAGEACSSGSSSTLETSLREQEANDAGGSSGGSSGSDSSVVDGASTTPGPNITPAMVGGSLTLTPATLDSNPTNPTDGGAVLSWTTAPQMGQVSFESDRDSVKLVVPSVPNAVDYRAILLTPTVGVSNDGAGHETVTNATIVCAGFLQRNIPTTTQQLVDTIAFPGITANSHIVIEAIDTMCPFTGVVGATHANLNRTTMENAEIKSADSAIYSVYTEADVDKTYGSMIINGQGGAAKTGMPAPVSAPKVLQRTTVVVSPMGTAMTPPVSTFFDDFSANDQPALTSSGASQAHPYIDVFQNTKWTIEAAATDIDQYFVDRGQLHDIIADTSADVFAASVAYPKQLAQLSDTSYLHIVYDVNSITSDRRYWWISVCGSDTAGQTMAANGSPTSYQNPDSSLQEGDGNNPNLSGYNCIDVFPKNGAIDNDLPLGNGKSSPPETDVRILIYGTGKGVTGTNVSPDQYKNGYLSPSWYREMNGTTGAFLGPMLEQDNLYAPLTHYDLFVRRNRVVLYADGQQKLCNDFPASMVTMSEAMVGFGHVLYHTSAEHNEIAPGNWQRDVYDNLKYFDRRDWDNLGFDNGVQPPTTGANAFNEALCYVSPGK
jgi:hypothetical protein